MSYRDDHEALLARIAALESAAARSERLEQRVRELEDENRRLRQAATPAPAASTAPPGDGVDVDLASLYVDDKVTDYMAALVAATGAHAAVVSGAQPDDVPRIDHAARKQAADAGRRFVTPADVKAVLAGAIRDRVILASEAALSVEDVIAEVLSHTDVP